MWIAQQLQGHDFRQKCLYFDGRSGEML